MLLIKFFIIYVITMSPAVFLADRFNKSINKTIPLSLVCTMIIMYVLGLVNLLKIGVVFVIIFNIGLLVYTIIKNIKNKTINELKEKIITNGSIFFTVIFFVFLAVTMNRELTHWDQFSYWSLASKDMYTNNKLLMSVNTIAIYPPAPMLLQYFYMNVLGEYLQGIEVFTTWILGFAFLLPLFEKSNGKKISNIVIGIIILCIPAVFNMLIFYESSYPDALMGLIIGFILYMSFFEKDNKFKIFSIVLALILLSLTKSIGIIIAGISIISIFVYELLTIKNNKEKIFSVKNIKASIIYIVTIIVIFTSWNIYLKVNNANEKPNVNEHTNISEILQSITTTVFGVYQENNDMATSNGKLLEKLYSVTEISTPVQISAMGTVTIFLFIMLVYYYKASNKQKSKNMIITIFVGLILYILALQFAYITQFSAKEMLAHDGMERYIATYLLAMLYILVVIFLDLIKEKNKNILYIILASIVIMITPLTSIANATITSGIYNIDRMEYCDIGRYRADKIKSEINENDKVLGICQDQNIKLIDLMIRYYMYPIKYDTVDKIDKSNSLKDILNSNEYDYIYIVSTDNYLDKELNNLLGIQNVEKDKLYKINTRSE